MEIFDDAWENPGRVRRRPFLNRTREAYPHSDVRNSESQRRGRPLEAVEASLSSSYPLKGVQPCAGVWSLELLAVLLPEEGPRVKGCDLMHS
jgi:hypothetical protein